MSLLSDIEGLLQDDDLSVRTEVIYLLYLKAGEQGLRLLEEYLNHADPRLQTAAVACMAEHQLIEARELLDEDRLETFLVRTDSDAEKGRVEVARLLGVLLGDHYRVFLAQLLADRAPEVVQAAIATCGRRQDADFVEALVARLADYRYRAAAKDALAAYGKNILPLLSDRLHDHNAGASIRRNLPGVMWRIRDAESVQTLLDCVRTTSPALRFFVVKALNKLHRAVPTLRIDAAIVQGLIFAEIEELESNHRFLRELSPVSADPRLRFLMRALRERCDQSLELVFRLLGLIYPTPSILGAYLGVISSKSNLRAGASEFLDNFLQGELRRRILIAIEQWTDLGRQLTRPDRPTTDISSCKIILIQVLHRNDPWLQTLALAGSLGIESAEIREIASTLVTDSDTFLREMAITVVNS